MTRKLENIQRIRDDYLEKKYGSLTVGELGALFVTLGVGHKCYQDILEAYSIKILKNELNK